VTYPYLTPAAAWCRFLFWMFMCIGAAGGVLYMILFVLRIWIDNQ
jgi:hypothetical protein